MQNILEGLNNKQYEAVVNTEGPCLVIARSRKWKNQSTNSQNSLFNRRKTSKTMGHNSNHIYQQSSQRNERKNL